MDLDTGIKEYEAVDNIYDRYSSIFDIPAYAVHMKPVLLVDGEIAAKGEEYLETTLGTIGSAYESIIWKQMTGKESYQLFQFCRMLQRME